jgi:hypothetical protein
MSTSLPEDPAFDLVCHLVSAARGAPEEGPYTASLRLLHAAGTLAGLTGEGHDGFLDELAARIGAEGSAAYLRSAEDYVAFLDGVLADVAREVRRRNGLG